MCECHQIGGPFIAEDPNCPVHGYEAQRREAEQYEDRRQVDARLDALENTVDDLLDKMTNLANMVRLLAQMVENINRDNNV